MKNIISASLVLIIVLSSLFCLSSCKKEDDASEFDISEYDIVYPSRAGDDLITAAKALKDRIKNSTSAELSVKEDMTADGEDTSSKKEILVGETDRPETVALKSRLDAVNNDGAFAIEASENKIMILGKNENITVRAIKYFVTNFVKEGKITIEPSYSIAQAADTNTVIFPENLVELKFGDKTTVITHADKLATQNYYYPTAVKLQYQTNDADNGKMIATLNSSEEFYRILESSDDGANWNEIAQVYDRENANCRGGRMPMLYELPDDMGEYKKGTVVLAGTSSALNTSSDEKSAIVIYYSSDAGKTWSGGQSIDFGAGRTDGEGVWEPCLIYEEETGRLYCFYSDDRDPAHDQKLVYKYTTDLASWTGSDGKGAQSEPFEAVASSNSKHRPGMVSVTKMANGEYIMVYEVGHSNYKDSTATVHYKKSSKLDDWGDVSDIGPQLISTDGVGFGSAPWCAYTSVGGENGLFITTGRYRDDRNSNPTEPDLFISFDYGNTFVTIDNPFDYSNTDLHLGKFGYSPFFLVANEGKTIYYFNTSVFAPANKTQYIEMIRIDVID